MVGHHKGSIDNAIAIENILKSIAPEYIYLINNLLTNQQI
jgi:hypothetical protein